MVRVRPVVHVLLLLFLLTEIGFGMPIQRNPRKGVYYKYILYSKLFYSVHVQCIQVNCIILLQLLLLQHGVMEFGMSLLFNRC